MLNAKPPRQPAKDEKNSLLDRVGILERLLAERTAAIQDVPVLRRQNDALASELEQLSIERNAMVARLNEFIAEKLTLDRDRVALMTWLFSARLSLFQSQERLLDSVAPAVPRPYAAWLKAATSAGSVDSNIRTEVYGGVFDPTWYSLRYDIQPDRAVENYEEVGKGEGRWPNALFDPEWYVRQVEHLTQERIHVSESISHYIRVGSNLAISPHPVVDHTLLDRAARDRGLSGLAFHHLLTRYGHEALPASAYFDVDIYSKHVAGLLTAPVVPLVHYLHVGDAANLQPRLLFDPKWYRLQQISKGVVIETSALEHYLRAGYREGINPHPLFSHADYPIVDRWPEAVDAEPLKHYLTVGAAEGQQPHWAFDPVWYLTQLKLLHGEDPRETPSVEHYLGDGWRRGIDPHLGFLSSWYIDYYDYRDKTNVAPILDFLTTGWMHGRRPNPWFDPIWYLSVYAGVAKDGVDAYEHFVKFGIDELRQPGPDFGPTAYLERYEDLRIHKVNPYRHFLQYGHQEGRSTPQPSLEPVTPRRSLLAAKLALKPSVEDLIGELHAQLTPGVTVTHLITVPFFVAGGAELVVSNLIAAITANDPAAAVVLVIMDRPDQAEKLDLPSRCFLINLGARTTTPDERCSLLLQLLHALQPPVFHNVNSVDAWQVIIRHGGRIKAFSQIVGSIFAFQYTANGVRIGFAEDFLRGSIGSLSLLMTDNDRFVKDAKKLYQLTNQDARKLVSVYNPVSIASDIHAPPKAQHHVTRPRFLWAGRLDDDKRPDLLFEVIKEMPLVDFEIFGRQVVNSPIVPPTLANAHFHGGYTNITQALAAGPFLAFIMTTKWEGMPNILLEMAALGIPVIAPLVGGIGEVLDAKSGFPVPARATSADYIRAIHQIVANPEGARARSLELRRRVSERHTWEGFLKSLRSVGYLPSTRSTYTPTPAANTLDNPGFAPDADTNAPSHIFWSRS
jgi:glycosyltransferase involved in cell wall biosynthesis